MTRPHGTGMTGTNLPAGETTPLLEEPRFRRFAVAMVFSQVGDNALNYGLLVMVVRREDAAIYATLLVISFLVPSLLFGLTAGLVVDKLPKRFLLTAAPLLRAAALLVLLMTDRSLWEIYLAAAWVAVAGRFQGPAEASALPAVAGTERLVRATAMMNLITATGQGIGMVLVAPLTLKALGEEALLVVVATLNIATAWWMLGTTNMTLPARLAVGRRHGGLRAALTEGIRAISADSRSRRAMIQLTVISTALLILVSLIPAYTLEVLGTSAENAVFLFTPAVLGVVVGLRFADLFAGLLGPSRLASAGFYGFLFVLGALGLGTAIPDLFTDTEQVRLLGLGEVFDLSPESVYALLLVIPGGFAYAVAATSAKAVLTARSPVEVRGRVFATQVAVANLASLVPLLGAGLVAGLTGSRAVMLGTALLGLILAWLAERGRSLRRS